MSSSASHPHEEGSHLTVRRALWTRRGVLLINLGTPEQPDVPSVRRYLAEFLGDPKVIQLPPALRWMNGLLGRTIARLRAPKSAALYRRIWTERGSPLGTITEEQASKLEAVLPDGWRVFTAMRYGRPSIEQSLREIEASGVEELVVIPMYPHYSGTTTGTAIRELYGALHRGMHRIDVTTRNSWYDDGAYIHAQAKLLAAYAKQHQLSPDSSFLLFSAHGLPVSYVKRGDPYPAHVNRTIDLVAERLGWPADRMTVGYQSRFGMTKWLTPSTDGLLMDLIKRGEERVLVCPISFTTDCLETLEELDVRYRKPFEERGGDLYICPALNTHQDFIAALAGLVLKGPRSITTWGEKVKPLLCTPAKPVAPPANVDTLVMIGVSLRSNVGRGRGPQILHTDDSRFQCMKKSQHEVPEALRKVCRDGHASEAFVWNTCHRFEFYGWPKNEACGQGGCIVRRVRESLFDACGPNDYSVNVLCGADAWQHLVRTTAGLNSRLPGDRDIVDQLQQAFNVAERAGTTGPMTKQLIRDAMSMEERLRKETEWGKFDPGYCYAALVHAHESKRLDLVDKKILVIGGSTTSRSILSTLTRQFDVSTRQLTLVYRGHSGGQIKLLRKAIGNGKRLRVGAYTESSVMKAIADSDVVFFGIDRDEPVLHADDVRGLRDFGERPLTVIDFNTFSSTTGLEELDGVRLVDAKALDIEVESYGDAMCASSDFARAVAAAEAWIVDNAPVSHGDFSTPKACHGLVGEAAGEAANARATRVEDRWKKCVVCSGHNGAVLAASGGTHD